jgi:hypothetical protein
MAEKLIDKIARKFAEIIILSPIKDGRYYQSFINLSNHPRLKPQLSEEELRDSYRFLGLELIKSKGYLF